MQIFGSGVRQRDSRKELPVSPDSSLAEQLEYRNRWCSLVEGTFYCPPPGAVFTSTPPLPLVIPQVKMPRSPTVQFPDGRPTVARELRDLTVEEGASFLLEAEFLSPLAISAVWRGPAVGKGHASVEVRPEEREGADRGTSDLPEGSTLLEGR